MAVLYDCSNNIPLLTSNIIELPYSPSVGIQPFTFYFATQDKYEQPTEDKNFKLIPGIDYCIKFEATTSYRYQMCFQTKCIIADVQGYYYSKYC